MWSRRVVVLPPAVDQYLRLSQRVEDLTVEQFVTQLTVKALNESVLPGTTGFNVQCRYADIAQPVSYSFGRKLRTIIRADVLGHSPRCHQPRQTLEHIIATEIPCDIDREALSGMLVDHRQHPEASAFFCSSLYEVVAPHMILVLRPESDTAAVIKPESSSFRLFPRHFEPFLLPDPLDSFVIHTPAFKPEHRCNPSVPVSSIHAGELDDPLRQRQLIVSNAWQVPL